MKSNNNNFPNNEELQLRHIVRLVSNLYLAVFGFFIMG